MAGVGTGYAQRAGGVYVPTRLAQQPVDGVPRQGGGSGRVTGRNRVIGYTTAPPKARQVWELHRAREESRQLAITSPHWRAYLKWADGQVLGKRPTELAYPMRPSDSKERLGPAIATLRKWWRRFHYRRIGMRGENLLYLRAQVLYTRLVDGDCFVVPRNGPDGRPRYMFLPGDALAETETGYDAATGWSRALGVATDEWGLPKAYFFGFGGRARPSGYMSWSSEVDPVRVSADRVWHLRERFEDGTTIRSYPWVTAAIDYVDKLHQYRASFIRSAVARAAVQLFLSSHPEMGSWAGDGGTSRMLWDPQQSDGTGGAVDSDAERLGWEEAVANAGEVLKLPPGYRAERMDTGSPSQNDYMEVRSMERAICAALRASPMALLADYQGVSFSSAQHASGHERTSVEGFQAWIGMDLIQPVYQPWFAEHWPDLLREHPELRSEDYEVLLEADHVFRPYQPLEKHRLIGPVKEAWDGGLFTLSRARAELGEDASDIESMIAEWQYERELYGLPAVPDGAGRPPAPDAKEYDRPPTEEEERAEAKDAEAGEGGTGEGDDG